MRTRAKRLGAAAVLLMALVAGACSSDQGDTAAVNSLSAGQDAPEDGGGAGRESEILALEDTATQYSADGGGGAPDAYLTSAMPERVIKTADLELEVEDGELESAMRRGREIAEASGGFLLSTSVDGVERRRGEFTIRVPAGDFGEVMSALEELGTVTREEVRGQDVSQEFVDLEARLRNATAQEEVLFRLYDRSQSISYTIRVQRELEDVQLEIERLRGRLRFLEDRTDLSTISVMVTESGAVTAAAGPFERAWDEARDVFVAVVSGVIVGAGFVLPLIGFALVAYVIFRLVRPRLQRAGADA